MKRRCSGFTRELLQQVIEKGIAGEFKQSALVLLDFFLQLGALGQLPSGQVNFGSQVCERIWTDRILEELFAFVIYVFRNRGETRRASAPIPFGTGAEHRVQDSLVEFDSVECDAFVQVVH